MKKPSILRAVALAAATLALASGASAQQMTTLKFIWEVKPTANDFMTTQSTYERDLFSSTNRGAIAYVPYAGVAGTVPLYRLVKNTDHMDSKVPNEGGYTNEGVTGYIWTSGAAVRGLGELKRLVKRPHDPRRPPRVEPPGLRRRTDESRRLSGHAAWEGGHS